MSELREAVEQYLQLRSELGYKMHRVTRMLRSFVAFAEQEGAADITTNRHSAGPSSHRVPSQRPGPGA
jgi:hypothetical protein